MESLSAAYLEEIAQIIDVACVNCFNATTNYGGRKDRRTIDTILTTLGTKWDETGAQGTKFTEGLKHACVCCLTTHRETPRLERQFSCGIRQATAEKLNTKRPNITSRVSTK